METKIYTLAYCPFCKKAKNILREQNICFKEIDVTAEEDKYSKELSREFEIKGEITYPQIIINGKRIGGCSDLEEMVVNHALEKILKEE
jgi:glutaredoxin 3